MSAFLLKNLHFDQSNIRVLFLDDMLTFSRPAFSYVNACRNTHLEIFYLFQQQGNLLHF
jgi:hypothetical protein